MRISAARVRVALVLVCGCALALAGCASVQVSDREKYQGPKLARPDAIIVHDIAATPTDLPTWSAAYAEFAGTSPPESEEEIEAGRKLGAEVAKELVKKIGEMGLPAFRYADHPDTVVGDIVLIGYFTTLDKGSALKRVALGFGSGSAEVTTAMQGYLQSEEGMRLLGSGTAGSKAGKMPGVVVPLAVTIATANPIGLAVGGAVKLGEEVSGHSKISGVAERVADKIASELQGSFEEQGWIEGS